MIQLKVYPSSPKVNTEALFLDLYEQEPIKLNLSIEDITNADATSTYSKTFRVPATRHNSEFFENAYLIDGVTYDITIKKPAEILVDGAEFKMGHIRLQQIFVNGEQDKIEYELLFLGETRDLSSIIADKTMCELVMTDFDWTAEGLPVNYTDSADFIGPYTFTEITQSWDAYPQGTTDTDGYAQGNLLFPLIDHGNTYDASGAVQQPFIAIDNPNDFTNQNKALSATRLKPMIRVKRLWDQIFEDSGYTYESDFFDSLKFKSIYLSAFGNNESVNVEIGQITTTLFSAEENNDIQGAGCKLYLNDAVYNPSGAFNVGNQQCAGGSYFTASGPNTQTSYYIMHAHASVDAFIENSDFSVDPIRMRIKLVNTSTSTTLATGNWATGGNQTTINFDSRSLANNTILASHILKLEVEAEYAIDWDQVTDVYWDCTAAPGDYYVPRDLDCDYKQIDFIKDVLTAFRLVMQPDAYRPNHFIIEPWQDFIGSGTTYDWSDKLVNEKDFVIEPLFNTQSATIEFTMTEDEDYINKFHQDNYKHPYGWLRFDSQNELLKGKRDIKLNGISPTPIDQIEQKSASTHAEPQWVLPIIHKHEAEGGSIQHLPIKTNSRMLFYNGEQSIIDPQHYWWLTGGPGNPTQLSTWPLVSPYENWPVTPDGLNLNFYNDIRYYIDPSPGSAYFEQGETLYDQYWSRYISSLYNKFSRRVTAYFILNNVDLQNLTFDDVIFVNGVYYRPEKIIDAQIGEKTAVKCQLITVKDVRPKWADELLTGFSASGFEPDCAEGNGYIQIQTNGTPQFSWELDNGMTGTHNAPVGQAPYTFNIENVPPGDYEVTVTDSVGRTATLDVTVPVSTATPVSFDITTKIDPTDCEAPCNGQVSIAPVGGTSPYTLYWSDGTTQTTTTDVLAVDYGINAQTVDPDPFGAQLTPQSPTLDPDGLYHTSSPGYPYNAVYFDNASTIKVTFSGTATFATPVGGEITPVAPRMQLVEIVGGIPSGSVNKAPTSSNWPSSYVSGPFSYSLTYEFSPNYAFQAMLPVLINSTGDEVAVTFDAADIKVYYNEFGRTDLCPGSIDFYFEDANGCYSGIGNVNMRCDEPATTGHTWAPIFYDESCLPSLGILWEYTEDTVSYAPLTVATLDNKQGCYMLLDQPALPPTTTVLTIGEDCQSCTAQPIEDNWVVRLCDDPTASTIVVDPNGFTLAKGMAVHLQSEVGGWVNCYEVLDSTVSASTDTVAKVYRDCRECFEKTYTEILDVSNAGPWLQQTYPPLPPGYEYGMKADQSTSDPATYYDPYSMYDFYTDVSPDDAWALRWNSSLPSNIVRVEFEADMTVKPGDETKPYPMGKILMYRRLVDAAETYIPHPAYRDNSPTYIVEGWPTVVDTQTHSVSIIWNNLDLQPTIGSYPNNPINVLLAVNDSINHGSGNEAGYNFTNIRIRVYYQ